MIKLIKEISKILQIISDHPSSQYKREKSILENQLKEVNNLKNFYWLIHEQILSLKTKKINEQFLEIYHDYSSDDLIIFITEHGLLPILKFYFNQTTNILLEEKNTYLSTLSKNLGQKIETMNSLKKQPFQGFNFDSLLSSLFNILKPKL